MRTPVLVARWLLAALLLTAAALLAAGCGGSHGGASAARAAAPERPSVVVTYSVLGSLVQELAGDEVAVTVLMPNGADPHEWQPSAKDVEAVTHADLVVANGLDLEEGLEDTLDEAEEAGVRVFYAADHVRLRRGGEHAEDEHGGGADDPHIWTDPLAMKAVVAALAGDLALAGVDVRSHARELEAGLDALDAEVRETLAAIPADRRQLVTGHESMGYFADRYGFELVGAVVPSLSSQAEPSASELAELGDQIEEAGATEVFTELGTPDQVAEAIAGESGAEVVELASHTLPENGSYFAFVRDIAGRIAAALAPSP